MVQRLALFRVQNHISVLLFCCTGRLWEWITCVLKILMSKSQVLHLSSLKTSNFFGPVYDSSPLACLGSGPEIIQNCSLPTQKQA